MDVMTIQTRAEDYLLGKLSDEEQTAIEERFFTDASAFDDLLIAENALTDRYVRDRLTHEERTLFEQRLMLSSRQIERTKFAKALIGYASRQPRSEISEHHSVFESLMRGWSRYSLTATASMAAVLILAMAGLWLISRPVPQIDQPSIAKKEERPVPSEPLPNATNAVLPTPAEVSPRKNELRERSVRNDRGVSRVLSTITTIALPLGSTRGAMGGSKFKIDDKATGVKIVTETEPVQYSSYFALVETVDGQQIWRGPARAAKNSAAVVVPAAKLKSGDYILTLKGRLPNGTYQTVQESAFTIERK